MPRLAAALCFLVLGAGTARSQELTIDRWLVRGPIPTDTGVARIGVDYLDGEASIRPGAGDEGWRAVEADAFGKLDLKAALAPAGVAWSVAYAAAYVHTHEERVGLLIADSDDDLVVYVNGERVWLNEVARGLGSGRDTAVVRLGSGWNLVFFKVFNRSGEFGLLGRLAAGPGLRLALERPDSLARPEPTVTAGPILLDAPLVWHGGELRAAVRVPIAAWGVDSVAEVAVRLESEGAPLGRKIVPRLAVGEPAELNMTLGLGRLRDAALGRRALAAKVTWPGGDREMEVSVSAQRIMHLLGGRIAFNSMEVDSMGASPSRLAARVIVPKILAGARLDLLSRGLGPRARYLIDGWERAWRDGRVSLCAPCQGGDSLTLSIEPEPGRPLWELPMVRVGGPGYREYSEGYGYAERLTGETPPIGRPDAREWLRALGDSAETSSLRARYRQAYAPLASRIRRDTLHLIGNSHIDAAWLWPWSETIEVIRDTWRTSLKLRELFPGYIFAASSAAYYDAMDRLHPGLADSIARAADASWWVPVGGWWVEADMNLPSGESLVRQGLYGQRYFQRRFGRRSKVAWTPDTFGYPWSIPQILRGQGFEYFVTQKIRWNDSTEFPHNAFVWEGLDGSRIFTYNPYGYVHDLDADRLLSQRIEDRERTGSNHQIVLYGVGDHGGGPTIEMLERAEDLRRVPTFPVMRYARPLEAMERVEAASGPAGPPVWRDELYLEYHRGTYTSQAFVKWLNRRGEAWLRKAEALAAVSTLPYPRRSLAEAWQRFLFNQFHDILPGSSIPEVYADAQQMYGEAMTLIFDTIIPPAFADLRARMDTRGPGDAVVVFNGLGWERDGWIRLPDRRGSVQRVSVGRVPAFGARVIHLPADSMAEAERRLPPPTAGRDWIQNAFLRVELDTLSGVITRLYDRENGREVLSGGGNVLQIFKDEPEAWDAWNIVFWEDSSEVRRVRDIQVSADPRQAQVRIERFWGRSTFIQTLTLDRGGRLLDIQNDIDWKEEHKLLKVAFILGLDADSATFEIPYGTIGRSGQPATPRERAKTEVPGQRWADVSETAFGVSILNDGKYGWDYRGNVLRLSLLRSPTWPDSLADREWHSFRFALYPHPGDWRDAGTVRRAAEYNSRLHWGMEPKHDGRLGRSVSFASAGPENVNLTALKRAEDSDAWVLRLVEWHGRPADARVEVACPIRSARRANLLEDPGPVLESDRNEVRLAMRPHEIATVLIECGG